MPLTRREAMAGCGAALLTGLPAFAQAAYPSQTVKMIVPYPAGGTTDLLGRLVADQLRSGLARASVSRTGGVAGRGRARPRRDIVDQRAAQIEKLLADPATRDRLTTLALEPLPGSTPDSFAAYVKTEIDRWAVIVKNSGAMLE
jgi:tripartite-type tricarboxylate transporter receptor subunit TctC